MSVAVREDEERFKAYLTGRSDTLCGTAPRVKCRFEPSILNRRSATGGGNGHCRAASYPQRHFSSGLSSMAKIA